jgi:hypothetical protein
MLKLEPGCSIGVHKHAANEETYVFISERGSTQYRRKTTKGPRRYDRHVEGRVARPREQRKDAARLGRRDRAK